MQEEQNEVRSFENAVKIVEEGRKLKNDFESGAVAAIEQMRQFCVDVLQNLLDTMNTAFSTIDRYPELKYEESRLSSIYREMFRVGCHPAEFRYIPQINKMYPSIITCIRNTGNPLDISNTFGYEPHELYPGEEKKVSGFSTTSVERAINHMKNADMAIGNWIHCHNQIKTILVVPKLIRDAVVFSAQKFRREQQDKLNEINELTDRKYEAVV